MLRVERFGDVVGSAVFEGFLGHFDALVAGDDDNGQAGFGGFDLLQDVHAVPFGHFDIEQHEVGGESLERLQRLDAVHGEAEVVVVAEDELEGLADAFLVVANEDGWLVRAIGHFYLRWTADRRLQTADLVLI